MRVLHLIDSLEIGGAERVAVNLANALNEYGIEAYLAVSRKEGPLKDGVANQNRYFFLGKKHLLDIRAFARLLQYVRSQRIQIVHAHSTSLAWAVALTIFIPIPVVWHNHFGNSLLLNRRNISTLRWLVKRTSYIIAVNRKLASWAIEQLNYSPQKVSYLPNFPDLPFNEISKDSQSDGIPVIVCTANLRVPKDHETLVVALGRLKQQGVPFRAWLIGKDSGDDYSRRLKEMIVQLELGREVQILGSQSDTGTWLSQADIGVLSSSSEGLPVALLEYGLAGLPAVCTSVGECPEVLGNGKYGILVPPKSPEKLADALRSLLTSSAKRREYGRIFQVNVLNNYSKASVVAELIKLYERILEV